MLSSRISLATLKGHGPPYSTVTGQSCNSLKPNGSACSAGIPWTSTMSFQTSTQCHMAPTKLLSSERTSSYSMDHPLQQKLSKLTETGLSRGTAWSMRPSSCSNTEDRNCSPMESTSSVILHPCHPSSTARSLTMTEQSESGQLSDAMWSSQISPNSLTCRFSGSATPRDSPRTTLQIPTMVRKAQVQRDNGVLPVEDGMRTVVRMQLPVATTCMFAPNVPTQVTLQTIATPKTRAKSEQLCPSV